jgi:asparagine synthase (glutamine-hydrolysing)
MCGIVAAIGHIDARAREAVVLANARQRTRGPDAEGSWCSHGAELAGLDGVPGAVLAFRRLKILDLSERADQPMVDPETGNVLVFNGEIYNFQELRAELAGGSTPFRTQGDSEVILRAYSRWGEACVGRLRGMFGFVVWDARRRVAFVARDRLGIKPVYATEVRTAAGRRTWLIASSVRGLLATDLVDRRLDPVGLATYVWNGFVVGPGTILRGIRSLSPGHTAIIDEDGVWSGPRRYWRVGGTAGGGSNIGDVKARLDRAVREHLVSDVPLGVFLSGGKDSSAVTALAVKASATRIRTFNIAFDEAGFDESPYARRVAALLGTDHHELRLTEAVFGAGLDAALESVDQPTFDAINSYFVSKAVKDVGLTVAMAGTGGDELFGGYRTFGDLPVARRWSHRLRGVPSSLTRPAANAVARLKTRRVDSFPPQTRWGRLADAIDTNGRLVPLYQVAYGLFTTEFLRELCRGEAMRHAPYGLPPGRAADLGDTIASMPELHAISALELEMFVGDRLLRDTDAASMEVSLEVRVPLLDHEVVEALFALDPLRRFGLVRSKALLVELALADLPREMFDRPKRGFELPIGQWCRRGLRQLVAETLTDRSRAESAGLDPDALRRLWGAYEAGAPGVYWTRIWAMFVLLWWCRRHGVTA